MEIDNLVKESVQVFSGQKSSIAYGAVGVPECEAIENFVTRRTRLRKIWGTSLYHEAEFGISEIKWLDYFRNRWLFQRANGIGLETAEASQAFVQLGEIYGGTSRRVFSDKWTDSVFICNGHENKFIDFETLAQPTLLRTGLLPPGGGLINDSDPLFVPATFTVPAQAGSSLPAGDFEYIVTLWDDKRKVESMPYGSYVGEDGLWLYDSTIFHGATDVDLRNYTTGINGIRINVATPNVSAVRINLAPVFALGYDTDRVTHYIIYRKAADGTYKRVPRNGGADTSYVDDKSTIADPVFLDFAADASLGEVIDLSLSPPPSGQYYRDSTVVGEIHDYGPRFVKFHRDQLWKFGVNFPGTENGYENGAPLNATRFYPFNGMAYASAPGIFDYWQFTYSVGRETGQRDTFMGKHRNTLMFFKESSSYYLDGSSTDNYEIREMDNKRGITISGSAQETTHGIIGLGAEGFTLFDSVGPASIISEEIADMVEKINLEYPDKITSAFDPEEEKYECHCPIKNDRNTLVFIYDLKQKAWSFTKRAGGAAHYGLTSKKRTVGLLGDKLNGRLYLSTNRALVTQNGETMHGVWRSKQFDWGRPGDLKGLQMVTIVARAKRDFRLSIDVIPDFSQRDCVSVKDIDPDVREDVYAEDVDDVGGGVWDEAQWGDGAVKKEFTILVQAIGKKIQLIVRNSDTDADRANFEIEEIILWASLMEGEEAK